MNFQRPESSRLKCLGGCNLQLIRDMFAAKRAGQCVPCVVNDATQQTAPINLQPLVVTDVSALRHTENTLPTATLAGAWWALDHWYGCSRDYCLKCSIVDANFIFKHTPHRR